MFVQSPVSYQPLIGVPNGSARTRTSTFVAVGAFTAIVYGKFSVFDRLEKYATYPARRHSCDVQWGARRLVSSDDGDMSLKGPSQETGKPVRNPSPPAKVDVVKLRNSRFWDISQYGSRLLEQFDATEKEVENDVHKCD